FLAAAAATGGAVTLAGWPAGTTQPGRLLPALLEAMGATTTIDDRGLTVRGPADGLTGLDADLREYGEAVPTLTALAVLARTPSPRDLEEADVRVRARGGTRRRTRDRPAHLDAEAATIVAVDRGRYTCWVGARAKPGAGKRGEQALILAMRGADVRRTALVVG